MSDKLNFDLPKREQKGSNLIPLIVILLIFLIVIGVLNIVIAFLSLNPGGGLSADHGLTAEDQKDLALKLQKRSLYDGAVQAWIDYMNKASLSAKK